MNDFSPSGKASKKGATKVRVSSDSIPTSGNGETTDRLADVVDDPSVTLTLVEADPVGKRIEEMRAQRREREHVDVSGFKQKLNVPESLKDKRLEYRWVNDTEARHYEMTERGWDYASNETLAKEKRNSSGGSRIARIGSDRTTPAPVKTFLMIKPKEFYAEDKKLEQDKLKSDEAAIQRGESRDPQGLSGPGSYIPGGGTNIKHE